MSDEIGENMPIPEQQPKEGLPETPAKPEIKPIAGGAPWVVENPEKIENPKLKRIIFALEKTPENLRTEQRLEQAFLKVEGLYIEGVDEAEPILAEINTRLAELAKKKVEEEPEIERIKEPTAAVILREIGRLEEAATKENKTFEQLYSLHTAIQKAMERVPDKSGSEDTTILSDYLKSEYPEGVYLKEKLKLVFEARRRLHNRKTEAIKSNGDLTQLGATTAEVPLKGLKIEVTDIRPVDWYVLVRQDELFAEEAKSLTPEETREVIIPVNKALELWRKVGEGGGKLPEELKKPGEREEDIPFFYNILNSDEKLKELRRRMVEKIGNKRAEQLAYDIFLVTLSFDLWDKERKRAIGWKAQPRDLFHFEERRRREFYLKHGPPGPYDTVGCYFAKEHQGEEKRGDPDYDRPARTAEDKTRLDLLRKNRERALFVYSLKEPATGQIIGDFWESAWLKDERGRKKRLIEFVKERGWRGIPFLQMAEGQYSGYFTYSLVIASSIVENINKRGWDPKKDGLISVEFWDRAFRLFNRIDAFCPWINRKDAEKDQDWEFLEKCLNKFRYIFARGILWDGSYLAQPVVGKIWPRGRFSWEEAREIMRAIKSTGFLIPGSNEEKLLEQAYKEFNFQFHGG